MLVEAGINPFGEGCCALIRRTHPPQAIQPRQSLRLLSFEEHQNVKDSYRFGQPFRVYRLSYSYIAKVKADAEKATFLLFPLTKSITVKRVRENTRDPTRPLLSFIHPLSLVRRGLLFTFPEWESAK